MGTIKQMLRDMRGPAIKLGLFLLAVLATFLIGNSIAYFFCHSVGGLLLAMPGWALVLAIIAAHFLAWAEYARQKAQRRF